MRTVLDTSVLIGDSLDRVAGEVAISAISLAELHFPDRSPSQTCDPPDRNIVCLAHVSIYMVADSK